MIDRCRLLNGLVPIAAFALLANVSISRLQAQPVPNPVRATISIASDYILNGLAQTDSDPALRFGIDFEHTSGFFSGGSIADVGYEVESSFSKPRDLQLLLYSGYIWRRGQWMSNVSVARYLYPGITRSYDYSQLAATVSYKDRYFLTAIDFREYLGIYDDAKSLRLGISTSWIWEMDFEANLGRFSPAGPQLDSYTYWDIGVSRPFGRFAIDLRFHDNSFGRSSLLGNDAQNQWVFSATYALLPFD